MSAVAEPSAALIDLSGVVSIVEDAIRSVVSMCDLVGCVVSDRREEGEIVISAHYGPATDAVRHDVFIGAEREANRRLQAIDPSSRVRLDHQLAAGHRCLPLD